MFEGLKSAFKNITKKTKERVTEKEVSEKDFDTIFSDFEMLLLKNNVALEVIERIKADLKDSLVGRSVKRTKISDYVRDSLKDTIRSILSFEDFDLEQKIESSERPILIVFMGFNGSGKTTTIAKLAYLLGKKYKIVLAAADTFRAASIEQLEKHAKNLGLKVVKHTYGSDPAAVVFDAVKHAKQSSKDLVLADTAGRSHTNKNLMDELAKIIRVNKPDLRILVVDALVGNDVVVQAEKYSEVGFDAIIVAKADVDKKGGSILSLAYLTKKPIIFLGTGQNYGDLKKFNLEEYLNTLL